MSAGSARVVVGGQAGGAEGTDDGPNRLLARAGVNILRLGLEATTPAFLTRRNETIELLDRSTAQRSVECHIRVAEFGDTDAWPLISGEMYVPLARLSRDDGTHTTFTVVDESDSRMPRLSKAEERDLVLAGVLQVASEVLKRWPDDHAIAVLGAVVLGHEPASVLSAQTDADCRRLARSEEFGAILKEAYNRFFLIVPLAPRDDYARRVITYSYDERPRLNRRSGSRVANVFWPRPLVEATFDVPAVAETLSFHFELLAPADLAIPADCGALTVERPEEHGELTVVGDNDRSDRRAHFYYDRGRPVTGALANSTLRLADTGITFAMRAMTLAAAILMAITTAPAWFGDGSVFDFDNTEAWVTVLLVAPALVTAAIAGRSGHGLTSQVSRDARVTAAMPAFGLFVAAVALVAHPDIGDLRLILLLGSVASVVACIRLVNEWRTLRPFRRMQREATT